MENFRISTCRLRNILSDLDSGIINPSPAWQRGEVWTSTMQYNLVKTVMKNMPIPQLTFWQRPNGTSVVVDGRQRLTALQNYVKDDIKTGKTSMQKYEDLTEDEQRNFLNKNIQVLEFSADVEEEDIIDYFQRINAGGRKLTHGELINSHQTSPVVKAINSIFFKESEFMVNNWKLIFSEVQKTPRMSHIENTVPYLTSSLKGDVKYLTKSYPLIHSIISEATQEEVDAHLPTFIIQLKKLLEILGTIDEYNNGSWIDSQSWSGGLPLIRQIAPIWYSIIVDNVITNKEKSLPIFWGEFYRKIESNPLKKTEWELNQRKNSKPAQLKIEIDFAIKTVY